MTTNISVDSLSFAPLTPLHFLERSATVFADRIAYVDDRDVVTYRTFHMRTRQLSGALRSLGVEPGDRVAVLAPNTPLLLEAHYGVPGAGAVLVALNMRLSPAELGIIVAHSGTRLLLCDEELLETGHAAAGRDVRVVSAAELAALAAGSDTFDVPVRDERALLSLNYTSGTTGTPKGVMYHHRGAFLQSLAMAYHARLDASSVFLWTLPMFHCNGWCFTWAVTAAGATHVCLRRPEPHEVWRLIHEERITHLNAAPTVLTTLAHAKEAVVTRGRRIRVCTGGAPPSPTLIASLDALGIDVIHLYGLTETFGPILICEPQPEWDSLEADERARLVARQGVANVIATTPRILDAEGNDVPDDGATVGELALRGNDVMLGYFGDPELTAASAPDGWFRTGDLAVHYPDGYVEIRDRSKDIIISGGENIASVEIEHALLTHPAVLEAAVVAAPDPHWGEVPIAFVTLIENGSVKPEELIAHVKQSLASFKAPKRIVFGPLPKTATGKIQKFALREQLWVGVDRRVN